jgi:CRISPR/Cas system-associated protein Cas10 (large subunit of type III CRISPR-Cas system)
MKVSNDAKELVEVSIDNFKRSASGHVDCPSFREITTKGSREKAPGHMLSMAHVKLFAKTKDTKLSGATKMTCSWIGEALVLGDSESAGESGFPSVGNCSRRTHSIAKVSAESLS